MMLISISSDIKVSLVDRDGRKLVCLADCRICSREVELAWKLEQVVFCNFTLVLLGFKQKYHTQ